MIYFRYLISLLKHKWFVLRAGKLVGVPLWRLLIHDWSKFTPTEFPCYARWHFGNDKNKIEWAKAWHHHQRINPHHPEFWLLSWRGDQDFYSDISEPVAECVVVLPMSEVYVREMVTDLLAASKAWTGHWDIAVWINLHGPHMRLHSQSSQLLADILHEIGYFTTSNCNWTYIASDSFRKWAMSK